MDSPAGVQTPVASRFSELEPGQFREELKGLWTAAEKLGDAVSEVVEDEQITPYVGAAIMACITGQIFGYQEFHRELRPADLAQALAVRLER